MRKTDIGRVLNSIKDPKEIYPDNIKLEISLFSSYFEREWIKKHGNRFNFNKLSRTRSINAAESFHSLIKRYLMFFYSLRFNFFSDPASVIHGTLESFLTFLQQISAEYDSRIYKLENNLEKPKARNKIYEKIDKQLNDILDEYEA